MTRVLITCHTYYPSLNGVQAITQGIAESLASHGYAVTLFTIGKREPAVVNGVNVRYFDVSSRFRVGNKNKTLYRREVKKICENIDIMINVCTQSVTTDWLLPFLNELNVKKVLYMHGMYQLYIKASDFTSLVWLMNKAIYGAYWSIYYLVNANRFRLYDYCINVHKADDATRYLRKLLPTNRVEIIGNFVEEELFKVSEQSGRKENRIICIANYVIGKNIELAIRGYLSSEERMGNELMIIGHSRTRYYDRLKKMVNRAKQSDFLGIQLLYGISRNETIRMLAESKLLLLTSRKEVFPIVIAEAMTMGIPYISTNVGIVKYLPGGIIANTDKEIGSSLDKLLCNRKLRDELSRSGREYAEKAFHLRDKYDTLNKLLRELNDESM